MIAWHWISAAVALAGMMLFAMPGYTHTPAGAIPARPRIEQHDARLPESLRVAVAPDGRADRRAPLPGAVAAWLHDTTGLDAGGAAEWSGEEIYLSRPRPGGDAWIAIDRTSGQVRAERTDRGLIAFANDLHKGRNTGGAWSLFIDLFAVACVVFSLTGLLLLQRHAGNRPSTWPLVGLGLVIPLLLALLFIH
jgi:hypothetical protein